MCNYQTSANNRRKTRANTWVVKTNLKMACGEYRPQGHKYLPLAVLNHNTSYHASICCESTRPFKGRNSYNILYHKLGVNPNEQITPRPELGEGNQNRNRLLNDETKQNIMHSYLKFEGSYHRKARAAPLKENDYCFVLQPKVDHQGSKLSFRDYRWVGPFLLQKILAYEIYIVCRLITNKTQILHRTRLKKFVQHQQLGDGYREEKLQPDQEIINEQDDFCKITWETDFGDQLETRVNVLNPNYFTCRAVTNRLCQITNHTTRTEVK